VVVDSAEGNRGGLNGREVWRESVLVTCNDGNAEVMNSSVWYCEGITTNKGISSSWPSRANGVVQYVQERVAIVKC
jgi:hypothetical protein